MVFRILKISLLLFFLLCTNACVAFLQNPFYSGPPERPEFLEEYYARGPYSDFSEHLIAEKDSYWIKRIFVESTSGPMTIDFFQRKEPSDDLVLVFPVLGGRNLFSSYFADHFAQNGYDAAVVHRGRKFKNPDHVDELEQLFRNNIIRDRIALDIFEKEYGKKDFASFGISRGAMNAAVTAGIDKRLKYNVLAMGGSDLAHVFRDSQERGIRRYTRTVMARKNINEEELIDYLDRQVVTDPKRLAPFIDARKTLLILSIFDESVPINYGLLLREQIGEPKTIFLFAGHYTAVAYTQFARLLPLSSDLCLFPFDYIESETLAFYSEQFDRPGFSLRTTSFQAIQLPFHAVGRMLDVLF